MYLVLDLVSVVKDMPLDSPGRVLQEMPEGTVSAVATQQELLADDLTMLLNRKHSNLVVEMLEGRHQVAYDGCPDGSILECLMIFSKCSWLAI